jgi:hypothetical protein
MAGDSEFWDTEFYSAARRVSLMFPAYGDAEMRW